MKAYLMSRDVTRVSPNQCVVFEPGFQGSTRISRTISYVSNPMNLNYLTEQQCLERPAVEALKQLQEYDVPWIPRVPCGRKYWVKNPLGTLKKVKKKKMPKRLPVNILENKLLFANQNSIFLTTYKVSWFLLITEINRGERWWKSVNTWTINRSVSNLFCIHSKY